MPDLYQIRNTVFFALYTLTRPNLLYKMVTKNIYIPVYVQYEWLKNYKINIIIDIGAHQGNVTKALSILFPNSHIYAFEPNKDLHNEILSKVDNSKLTLESYAISNKVGWQKLYFADDTTLTSLLPLITPGKRLDKKIQTKASLIKTITLDNYFKNKKVGKNIFLKIDIEGAEILALKGGVTLLKKVSIIHLETYFENIYKKQELFEKVYDLLTKEGFRYIGVAQESYFYPKFPPQNVTNSVFINTKLVD